MSLLKKKRNEQMVALAKKGVSGLKIAKIYGIHHTTVYAILQRAGIKLSKVINK